MIEQHESYSMPQYSDFTSAPERKEKKSPSAKSVALMVLKGLAAGLIVLTFMLLMGLLMRFLTNM